MKPLITLLACILFLQAHIFAQTKPATDSIAIIALNQQIDDDVVSNNIEALKKLYADDFIFSHGSGKVEGKESWFNSVRKGSFLLRKHDSVNVELHPALAVVKGKLNVQKKNATKTDRYWLKYVRVYAYRNKQWQLVSHMTISEFHEPE